MQGGSIHSRYKPKTLAPDICTRPSGSTKFQTILDDGTQKGLPFLALGYAAVHQHSNGATSLVFKNFGTTMTMDHMSLGCSSKRNIPELAGELDACYFTCTSSRHTLP